MAGITKFLEQKTLAVVGVSRSEKKFSNRLYTVLKSKGYQLFGVNPNTDCIDGEPCFANIQSLPQQVNGIVIVVPPNQTEKVVKDAVAAGINHIWIQQGAESQDAIDFCKKNGVNVIHNQCILMFAEPSLPHKCHRYVWKVLGKLPI
ncbi:MAG TPA: CoA-binding protein [Candidatus Deferrimicrobium sp.]|nr:CoA-binding protein [Candidatus Deferrimicrobium sp.]